MAEWITKDDVLKGIITLMKNGKTLPESHRLEVIEASFPAGTEKSVIAQAIKDEQIRQVSQLRDQWYEIFVPSDKYSSAIGYVVDLELWKLAIKESLKLKDFKKVIDPSLVSEGIDIARDIIQRAKLDERRALESKWKDNADKFSDNERYVNKIVMHWTSTRIAHKALPFNAPDYIHNTKGERDTLLSMAKKMFPTVEDTILEKNILLFSMQYMNNVFCAYQCKNCKNCYSDHRKLSLEYYRESKRFSVRVSDDYCKKYKEILEARK